MTFLVFFFYLNAFRLSPNENNFIRARPANKLVSASTHGDYTEKGI